MSTLLEWRVDKDIGEYDCLSKPHGFGCGAQIVQEEAHAYNGCGITICASCVGKALTPLALMWQGPASQEEEELTIEEWLDAQPTREQWLMERVHLDLAPIFAGAGYTLPPVRVSCGWTGAGMEGCTRGICFDTTCSEAGVNEIYISPSEADAVEVLTTLMHELAHAVAGATEQHGEKYGTVCYAVGLTNANKDDKGEWPGQAYPGVALAATLAAIAKRVDAYPHAAVTPPPPRILIIKEKGGNGQTGGAGKQTSRLLKATCPGCGYVIRLTLKWAKLELPQCNACGSGGNKFALEQDGAEEDIPF